MRMLIVSLEERVVSQGMLRVMITWVRNVPMVVDGSFHDGLRNPCPI